MSADLLSLNERAAQLLLEQLPQPQLPVLSIDAQWPTKPKPIITAWQRRGAATDFTVWDKNYAAALLGLPRAREELAMNLQLAAARLQPGAPLVLFGLKDSGIVTAERALQDVFAQVTLALTKYHGRVFIARQPRPDLLDKLDDWRRAHSVDVLGHDVSLVSYPGLFAAGGLDAATALLLAQLPQLTAPRLVLDYACGTGVLAAAAHRLWPQAGLHLLDYDALALRAARLNVQASEYLQAENLSVCEARYDLILSNPPIHEGNRQSYDVVEKLVSDAPQYLARGGGQMVLVTQRTVPIQRWAKTAAVLTEAEGFRVWAVSA